MLASEEERVPWKDCVNVARGLWLAAVIGNTLRLNQVKT